MDIYNFIKNYLSENLGVDSLTITDSSKIVDDLNLTPLEIVDLITILSKHYNFTIPEDVDIKKFTAISDLISFVEQNSDDI